LEDLRSDSVTKPVEFESEEVMFERIVPFREPSPFKFSTPRTGHLAKDAEVKLDISRPQETASATAVTPRLATTSTGSQTVGSGVAVPVALSSMPRPGKAEGLAKKAHEAKLKGYEGDPCRECGQFTLVRNGTCLKCNTCGSTSGCS
jgi:hypothetical protein